MPSGTIWRWARLAEALPPEFRDCLLLAKPFGREQLVAVAEALVYVSNTVRGVVRLRPKNPPSSAAVA